MKNIAKLIVPILLCLAFLPTSIIAQAPIAGFSSNNSVGCPPLNVTFNNASQNATGYWWDFGNGNTSTLAQPVNMYTMPGTYTVTLVAYGSNGSTDTTIQQNYVSVHTPPTAAFTISQSTTCANGLPVSLTNSSSNASSYTWDFGDGQTSNQTNPSHVYSAQGTYSITLIANSIDGCSDVLIQSQAVVVHPQPSASFSIDTNAFCDTTHQFMFAVDDSSTISWLWSFGDGSASSLSQPNHTYNTFGSFDVSLSVSNSYGCENADTLVNHLNVYQPFEAEVLVNDTMGCADFETTFVPIPAGNVSSALWGFGDGTSSSVVSPSKVYSTPGVYDIEVKLINWNGCPFTDTIPQLIHVLDTPSVQFGSVNLQGCAPHAASFSNSTQNASLYWWDFGDGNVSNQQLPTNTYDSGGYYPVTLVAEHNNGCRDSITIDSMIYVEDVEVTLLASPTTGCAPHQATFEAVSEYATQWWWTLGDGQTASSQLVNHTYSNNGNYDVSLAITTGLGCSDTLNNPQLISLTAPVVNFIPPSPIILCDSGSVSFNGQSIGIGSWHWAFGDGDTSVLANPSHSYYQPGTYQVNLSTQNGQGCDINISGYNTVIVSDVEADFSVSVTNCPNYEAVFTDSSTSAVAWNWEFGDGVSDTASSPVYNYGGIGYFSVSLTVTDSLGCTDTRSEINAVNLIVCPGDSSGGGFNNGNDPGVGGNDTVNLFSIKGCVPFQASFTNPFDSISNCYWLFGDGDTSFIANPIHTYDSAGSYDVKLYVQYQNGGFDSLAMLDFVKVGRPTASFTALTQNSCGGTNAQFTNTSSLADHHDWDFGDGGTDTIDHPNYVYTITGNYLVQYKASDTLGCEAISYSNLVAGIPNPQFVYDNEICLGDTVFFQSNVSGYNSYMWNFGDGTFSSVLAAYHEYTSAGTFQPVLYLMDTGGCIDSLVLPVPVTVLNPIAQFSINNGIACDSMTVPFQNLSVGATDWIWALGNGDTSMVENPIAFYDVQGTHSVTLIASNGNCSDQHTISNAITINKATANFNITQIADCLPVQASFTDQSVNAISWYWDFGDGDTSIVANPQHVFQNMPGESVKLMIVDQDGCSDSASGDVNFFQPAFTASAHGGCAPSYISFQDSSNAAIAWHWDFGDGKTSTLASPTNLYDSAGIFPVTLTAQSGTGCWDSFNIPQPIEITQATANFESLNSLPACAPLPVSFTDLSAQAVSWHWDFGDGSTSGLQSPGHVYTNPGNYNVSLIITDSLGCVDTLSKANAIHATGPIADFSVSDTSICNPSDVLFTNQSVNTISYEWFFGDGSTGFDTDPIHKYKDPGNYSVSLLTWDVNGCMDYSTFEKISVHTTPKADFAIETSSLCLSDALELSNLSDSLDQAAFHWDFGDGNIVCIEDTSYVYAAPGKYELKLIVINQPGCSDTSVLEDSIVVYDTLTPVQPIIHKVTVTSDSSIFLAWEPSHASNFHYYVIYKKIESSNSFVAIDTIENATQTQYFDRGLNTLEEVYCYKVLEVAHCVTPVQPEVLLAHCSMNVEASAKENFIEVSWTPYKGCDFDGYELYRKEPGVSSYQLIGKLDPSAHVFIDSTDLCPGNYSYGVRAIGLHHRGYYSESDTAQTAPVKNVFVDQHSDIIRSTVLDNQMVLTEWMPPEIGLNKVNHYDIYRKGNGESYQKVTEVPKGVTSFVDYDVQVDDQHYTYKIKVVNTCDVETHAGSIGNSVLLEAARKSYTAKLSWSAYQGWGENIKEYIIERKTESGEWVKVKAIEPDKQSTVVELTED